jgi:hypothetical protein
VADKLHLHPGKQEDKWGQPKEMEKEQVEGAAQQQEQQQKEEPAGQQEDQPQHKEEKGDKEELHDEQVIDRIALVRVNMCIAVGWLEHTVSSGKGVRRLLEECGINLAFV